MKSAPRDDDPQQLAAVAEILRGRLARLGINHRAAAKEIGVDRATVYNWLNQKMPVTMYRLIYWLATTDQRAGGDSYWKERALSAERALYAGAGAAVRHRRAWPDEEKAA